MPTSAPGSSSRGGAPGGPRRGRGFTLVELLVVLLVVALGAGVVSLSLRDGGERQLASEGERLVMLLETARAEARAGALPVLWVPAAGDGAAGAADAFRFVGLPAAAALPTQWLDAGVSAQVVGGSVVRLGPEALIGAQRIVLRLGDRRLELATDGLGPFTVVDPS